MDIQIQERKKGMSNVYGIDIGTSNFKMCCKEKDAILNEKNIIAIANKKELLAFGDEAYEMYEKAPENIEVSFPVKFGVIADIENMQTLFIPILYDANTKQANKLVSLLRIHLQGLSITPQNGFL